MSTVRGRVWRDGSERARDFPLAELDNWIADPAALVWLDITDPDPTMLRELASELSLDPVAVESALTPHERPKATRHLSHAFVSGYHTAVVRAGTAPRVVTSQVSAFVVDGALVTVRAGGELDAGALERRWLEDPELLVRGGVGALLYGLLDQLVDSHFAAIGVLDEAVEALEDRLFAHNIDQRELQRDIYAVRKALVELRRVVLPMREVVAVLQRHHDGGPDPAKELSGWFTDVYDHTIRAAEWTESLRDMVSSLFETNLSLQDARLNTIMKKLAAWGAIIAVPTAVTGWFGQNIPYPGFSAEWGLVQSVVVILGGTIGLYLLFRKFDWI